MARSLRLLKQVVKRLEWGGKRKGLKINEVKAKCMLMEELKESPKEDIIFNLQNELRMEQVSEMDRRNDERRTQSRSFGNHSEKQIHLQKCKYTGI